MGVGNDDAPGEMGAEAERFRGFPNPNSFQTSPSPPRGVAHAPSKMEKLAHTRAAWPWEWREESWAQKEAQGYRGSNVGGLRGPVVGGSLPWTHREGHRQGNALAAWVVTKLRRQAALLKRRKQPFYPGVGLCPRQRCQRLQGLEARTLKQTPVAQALEDKIYRMLRGQAMPRLRPLDLGYPDVGPEGRHILRIQDCPHASMQGLQTVGLYRHHVRAIRHAVSSRQTPWPDILPFYSRKGVPSPSSLSPKGGEKVDFEGGELRRRIQGKFMSLNSIRLLWYTYIHKGGLTAGGI